MPEGDLACQGCGDPGEEGTDLASDALVD